jgi:hypothetical protein
VPRDDDRGPVEAWVADVLLRESGPVSVTCDEDSIQMTFGQEARLIIRPDGEKLSYELVRG